MYKHNCRTFSRKRLNLILSRTHSFVKHFSDLDRAPCFLRFSCLVKKSIKSFLVGEKKVNNERSFRVFFFDNWIENVSCISDVFKGFGQCTGVGTPNGLCTLNGISTDKSFFRQHCA